MSRPVHPNYINASKLIFLGGGIEIIRSLISYDIMTYQSEIGLEVLISGILTLSIGWLIRQGTSWIKYLLLASWIISLFFIEMIVKEMAISTLSVMLSLVESFLSIWAMILLFKVPKKVRVIVE